MKQPTFPVQFTPQPGGGYYATCPILPGCHSQGDTLDEARTNIREAIALVIEDMDAHDEPVPDPEQVLQSTVRIEVEAA